MLLTKYSYIHQGAFWGLMIGIIVGGIRLALDFAVPAPTCGSNTPDERFSVVAKVDFLHFAIILAGICTICMVVISLFTKPRPPEKVSTNCYLIKNPI